MCGFDDGKKNNNTISNERKLVFFPFKCTLWVPVTIASSRLNSWTSLYCKHSVVLFLFNYLFMYLFIYLFIYCFLKINAMSI